MKKTARPHALLAVLTAAGLTLAATACSSDDDAMTLVPGDATDTIPATDRKSVV